MQSLYDQPEKTIQWTIWGAMIGTVLSVLTIAVVIAYNPQSPAGIVIVVFAALLVTVVPTGGIIGFLLAQGGRIAAVHAFLLGILLFIKLCDGPPVLRVIFGIAVVLSAIDYFFNEWDTLRLWISAFIFVMTGGILFLTRS